MADSDSDDLDIYINNSSSNIEDELITYLKAKWKDRRVSKIHLNSLKFY
jgi:hypothetical protein